MQEMQERQVWSLGGKDLLEKEKETHSSILAWRVCRDRGAWWATVHEVAKSWTLTCVLPTSVVPFMGGTTGQPAHRVSLATRWLS